MFFTCFPSHDGFPMKLMDFLAMMGFPYGFSYGFPMKLMGSHGWAGTGAAKQLPSTAVVNPPAGTWIIVPPAAIRA